ncbi:hypothetical protein DJ021_08705 [Phenylobacterium hankyongense]|uniref:Uncharacterized protein n=1 Tax=Phenylobacterium hankyongense TaxID=1813876 RepID=A0A328AXR2_9CAUL|nr:hypothetical protein [Phenylobacterium hankyongense]RAK59880.1 hypothetical protein DJ021_08705 [Phenylobacterium hankyongense]
MAPRPYAQTHPHLRAALLARIAAGELPTAVCAEPGMPCYGSVYAWARADPAFGAALADARRRGAWRRRWRFDEAAAKALLARLAAGEPLTVVLRDPAMPSRNVVRHWRATQGEFQGEVHRLLAAQDRARKARHGQSRHRPWDARLADRILVAVTRGAPLQKLLTADPALPCRNVLIRWRREQPDFDQGLRAAVAVGQRRRGRAAAGCTPALTELIVARIREGASLASLSREPDMPSKATLYGWIATRPDFAGEVIKACEDREDWYGDQMLIAAEAGDPATALARRHARLQNRPGRKWRT